MKHNCPFCNIVTEKDRVIRFGKLSTIFLSDPRLMPGHTLVIPNRHVEKPWQLAAAELLAIFKDIKFVESRLLKSVASGCDIRQNYRPFLPQGRIKIDHVHFHVLPRNLEDELHQTSMQFEAGLFTALNPEERKKMTAILSGNKVVK